MELDQDWSVLVGDFAQGCLVGPYHWSQARGTWPSTERANGTVHYNRLRSFSYLLFLLQMHGSGSDTVSSATVEEVYMLE